MKSEPHPESPASMLSVEQELLPCPFCGSDADVEHLENGRWSAGCVDPDGDCMGFQSLQTFPRKIVAINAWNTRHQSLSRSAGGANPPTIDAPERRGAVARLIDPKAWTDREDYLRRADEWQGKGLPESHALTSGYRNEADRRIVDSLTKADAILALLAASSGERGAAQVGDAIRQGLRDWRETFNGGVITAKMEGEMVLCIGNALLATAPAKAGLTVPAEWYADANRQRNEAEAHIAELEAALVPTPATVEEPKV